MGKAALNCFYHSSDPDQPMSQSAWRDEGAVTFLSPLCCLHKPSGGICAGWNLEGIMMLCASRTACHWKSRRAAWGSCHPSTSCLSHTLTDHCYPLFHHIHADHAFGAAIDELFLLEESDHAFGGVLPCKKSWCSDMTRRTVAFLPVIVCVWKSNTQIVLDPWCSDEH